LEIVCPSYCPEAETLAAGLPILAAQGVTAIEILLDSRPSYFDFRDLRAVEAVVSSLNAGPIRVHSIHAPFGPKVDFSSFDDRVHECGVESQIESMELAKVLGASVVVIHASDGVVKSDRQRRLDRARGVIRELARIAEESNLILAVENLPPGYLGCDAQEIDWLTDHWRSDWVSVCFDSGHANLGGRFRELAAEIMPHSAMTHLHDNDGLSDQHRFPGEGTIDWRLFGRLYREAGGIPTLMLECPAPKGMPWCEAFRVFRQRIGC